MFYHIPSTPNNIWEDKVQQNAIDFDQNTSFFFFFLTTTHSTTTHSKSFYIIPYYTF